MPNIFESVGVPRVGRSKFNLSYTKLLTCDMGQLIPVACEEVVPGDKWQIANEVVVRFQPLVAPILHAIWVTIHWFFVPLRILWEDFEAFITGGEQGDDASSLPVWTPTGGNVTNDGPDQGGTVVADNAVGSLWDYLGFPTGIVPTGVLPVDFPRRAYNMIWNEFYRDEWTTDPISETSSVVKNRAWRKDYFTSAGLTQQKGTAPSMPLSGTGAAVFTANSHMENSAAGDITPKLSSGAGNFLLYINGAEGITNLKHVLSDNTIDFSAAATWDVSDLRDLIAIQRWMELNARGGSRYVEWIPAHFPGAGPRDERLQRPEYVGGFRAPVIVSEVLQTSKTDGAAAQGTLAGHGITADKQFCGTYFAQEHGILMAMMSVMPEAMYQQGVRRNWRKESRYDYYDPMFAQLSEQAIRMGELYATGVEADNEKVFGYQGCWDELRINHNMVVGKMRSTFDYWHLSRQFAAEPALNEAFVRCTPRKDCFAAPTEVGLVVHVGNQLFASRLMPALAEPGFGGEA